MGLTSIGFRRKCLVYGLALIFIASLCRSEATIKNEKSKSEAEAEFEKKLNQAASANRKVKGEDIRRGGGIKDLDGICSREETLLPMVNSNSEYVLT